MKVNTFGEPKDVKRTEQNNQEKKILKAHLNKKGIDWKDFDRG